MLIARQNGHIDQAPWMKKPAGPVKEREHEREMRKKTTGPKSTEATGPQTHTHTHTGLIHFNESREEHKGITSINAKSIQHNRGYMQKMVVLLCSSLCVRVSARTHEFMDNMYGTSGSVCESKLRLRVEGTERGHPCV